MRTDAYEKYTETSEYAYSVEKRVADKARALRRRCCRGSVHCACDLTVGSPSWSRTGWWKMKTKRNDRKKKSVAKNC